MTASASTITDKKAQAEQLQREIDANGEKISMLAERYDAAKLSLDTATAKIANVQARTIAAQAETDRIERIVGHRAAAIYMNAGIRTPLDSINVSSVTDAGSRAKYSETTAERDAHMLDQLAASRQDLQASRTDLESARNTACGCRKLVRAVDQDFFDAVA